MRPKFKESDWAALTRPRSPCSPAPANVVELLVFRRPSHRPAFVLQRLPQGIRPLPYPRPHSPEVLLRHLAEGPVGLFRRDLLGRVVEDEDRRAEPVLELIVHRNPLSVPRTVLAEDLAQGIGDLPQRRPRPQRFLHRRHEVAGSTSRFHHAGQPFLHLVLIATATEVPNPLLLGLHLCFVHPQELGRNLVVLAVSVDPDHDSITGFNLLLYPEGGFVDLVLDPSGLDRGHRAS